MTDQRDPPSITAAMDLRDYERAKFELATVLRSVAALSEHPAGQTPDRLRALFVRLAEDRFNLVVVGRFNRGKTSLMNAILGTDRLPTGILPLTSVITTVSYGSKERVIIHYEDRGLASEVSIAELPEYVTQRGNPGNSRHVGTAEVQLPAEILRRGFYFIDTPGLGSSILENTQTTQRFLPEADAFVVVTSYESPLSEDELRVLRTACPSARKVFVVMNKQDTVSIEERAEALSYLRHQLEELLGERAPGVFSVSARAAIEAGRRDAAAFEASGLRAFEAELVRFLLEEKSTQFLLRLCDRLTDLIYDLKPCNQVAQLGEQVHRLAKRIADAGPGRVLLRETPTATLVDSVAPWALRSCEICARILQASFDFLADFQYQIGIRPEVQRQHADRGGFCALHTWQYASLASPHGICTGYPALLERLAKRVSETAASSLFAEATSLALRALLPTEEACLVCRTRWKAEQEAIATLADRLQREPRSTVHSSALCLPHFHALIAAIDSPTLRQELLTHESELLERLAEDMRRYATKHDAIRRYLASDEETHAGERALMALVGLRNAHRVASIP